MTNLQKALSLAGVLLAVTASATPSGAAPDSGDNGHASCAARDSLARMLTNYPAEWPTFALEQRVDGTATVRVDLTANGAPVRATIVKSTGSPLLDEAARRTAFTQKYSPELHDCAGIPSASLIDVRFE